MLARSCSSSPYSSVHFHANVLFLPSLIELLVRSQCKLGHLDYFDFKNKHQKKKHFCTPAYSAELVRTQKIAMEGKNLQFGVGTPNYLCQQKTINYLCQQINLGI